MSTIRSHRAELPGTPRMPSAVLALASTALLAWCGVIASGPSSDRPVGRFHVARFTAASADSPVPSAGSPVPSVPGSPAPDPAAAGAAPPGAQVAGPAAVPAGGTTRAGRPVPPTTGSAGTSGDGEARPGRPCRPDGATAVYKNGRLRCTSRPGSKEPRWRRNA